MEHATAPAAPLLDDASVNRSGFFGRAWRFTKMLVKVSRPGFYNVTGFLYIMPAASRPEALYSLLSVRAILGLLFCLLPMNLLVYGMNDLADVDIDAKNPRKGGLFGAVASVQDLRCCVAIAVVSCAFLPALITGDLRWSIAFSAVGIGANWVYNFGPQLSRVPLLDMFPPLAYLLVIPFGGKVVGQLASINSWFWFFTVSVVLRTQLWFQRMDIVADAEVEKRTTAVFVGSTAAAVGVFFFIACELVCEQCWGCRWVQIWSCFSALVFTLELWLARKDVTKALMAASGIVFLYPVLHCMQDVTAPQSQDWMNATSAR